MSYFLIKLQTRILVCFSLELLQISSSDLFDIQEKKKTIFSAVNNFLNEKKIILLGSIYGLDTLVIEILTNVSRN